MTPEEADEIIAGYMGHKNPRVGHSNHTDHIVVDSHKEGYTSELFPRYTQSLDALIPVWKKLDTAPRFYKMSDAPLWIRCDIWNGQGESQAVGNYTITEAAAIATAKAIKELKQ